MSEHQINLTQIDPNDPDAQRCYTRYCEELSERFQVSLDPNWRAATMSEEFRPPKGSLIAAELNGEVVGCGAVRFFDDYAEIKRMWVDPVARGRGIGRRILNRLESIAAENGFATTRLDTNSILKDAVALYKGSGYREVDRYNDNTHATTWYETSITGDTI